MLACLYMINIKNEKLIGSILLTSTGLSNSNIKNEFIKLVKDYNKSVAIITTANTEKENGKYIQLAYDDFLNIGFNKIDFIDFERQEDINLSSYDIFYVAGGNTFKLLKYSRLANFNNDIANLLQRGGIYIGVSAGSIILGPSIAIAGCGYDPDVNDVYLKDLRGFNFVDYQIYPHYNDKSESSIKEFENKYNTSVVRLSNDQAILISNNKENLI